jgi:hypothetical protein
MHEDNDDDNVIDFSRPAEQEVSLVPGDIVDILEILLEKAKEGSLQSLIVSGDFLNQDDDGEFIDNLTNMWNVDNNGRETIGSLEILKTLAVNDIIDDID